MVNAPLTNTYPVDFNGYVIVGRPLIHVFAIDVRKEDIVIGDGYISKVSLVEELSVPGYATAHHKGAVKINGEINMIRFPFEIVTVLRGTDELPVSS